MSRSSVHINGYDHLKKFVVVGDKGSGKSSLLLRLCDNTYTESLISSLGVDFKIKMIDHEDTTFKMQLWEKSSEEMQNPHRCSLRGAHAVVITLDMTRSEDEIHQSLENWLKIIDHQTDDENLIVVIAASKIDECKKNADYSNKYNSLKEFHEYMRSRRLVLGFVSSKTNENIENLFIATADVFKKKLDAEPASVEQKAQFISKLQELCKDEKFWSNKIRFQPTKIPDGVKHISNLLSNINPSSAEFSSRIAQVKEYAAHKHSSSFQWAHNLFRGRHEATNELYKILSRIDVNNVDSCREATTALKRYIKKYRENKLEIRENLETPGIFVRK